MRTEENNLILLLTRHRQSQNALGVHTALFVQVFGAVAGSVGPLRHMEFKNLWVDPCRAPSSSTMEPVILSSLFDPRTLVGCQRALVVLNQPCNEDLLLALWRTSAVRILADGAGTRFFTDLPPSLRETLIPDVICGDLDSLTPTAREHYASFGATIHRVEDQDSTDLTKCVEWLRARCGTGGLPLAQDLSVVVLSPFGGRLDHAMQNLNSLYTYSAVFGSYRLLSSDCTAALLPSGRSRVDLCPPADGPTVGLIPLGAPAASVTTRGFRWELTGCVSSFGLGGVLSTSNHVMAWDAWKAESAAGADPGPRLIEGAVGIETTAPLVWTCSVDCDAAVAMLRGLPEAPHWQAEPRPDAPVSSAAAAP